MISSSSESGPYAFTIQKLVVLPLRIGVAVSMVATQSPAYPKLWIWSSSFGPSTPPRPRYVASFFCIHIYAWHANNANIVLLAVYTLMYADFKYSLLLLQIPEEVVLKEDDHSSEVAEGLTYSGMPLR